MSDSAEREQPRMWNETARARSSQAHAVGRLTATDLARRARPELTGLVVCASVAAAVLILAAVSGSIGQANSTLVVMGFDPDRAQLITALLLAAIAAGVATIGSGRPGRATLAGLVAAAAVFGPTFAAETQAALAATGTAGAFDPGGWLLTLFTLLVIGVVSSWAGASVGSALRPPLAAAGAAAVAVAGVARRERRFDWRRLGRPLALGLAALILAVTVPVFGDLVNFSPDSHMLDGAPLVAGLVPNDQVAGSVPPDPSASDTPDPAAGDAAVVPTDPSSSTPTDSPAPTATPIPGGRPWLAWKPTGRGTIDTKQLPAPWKGGSTVAITVYLPPGYSPTGSHRYPVLYETATTFSMWDRGSDSSTVLDTMIDAGTIPPEIVVFIDSFGGPYNDSQCANSYDGAEWMDTFMGVTVPKFIDANYLPIASRQARTTLGMSQGGYCAAILAMRHPSTFGSVISFSGYFEGGGGSASAPKPFDNNLRLETAASPKYIAKSLTRSERSALYFVLVAKPDQPYYGQETSAFAAVLTQYGYPRTVVAAPMPHGWNQVRAEFPSAIQLIAARMAATGVFAS